MKYPKGHIIKKELYPPDSIEIKETTLLSEDEINDIISKIFIRYGEEFTHRAIYLPAIYDYILVKDESGAVILVPIKKKKKI